MRSTVPVIYDVSQKHVAADAAAAYAFWRAKEYDDSVRQPRGVRSTKVIILLCLR